MVFSKLGGGDDDSEAQDEETDDLMGGADDGLMGGGMMDGDDDEGDTESELTYQLDEIEKEIDSLEGQVETVRGENEKISDRISTVDRNVDKLVDLYEIVTEGVNPFAADQEIGNAFDAAEGGIFGEDDADIDDDIDDEITDAEADDFLSDEFDEFEDDEEEEFDDGDEEGFDDGDEGFDDGDEGFDEFEEGEDELDDEDEEFDLEETTSNPGTEPAPIDPLEGENGEVGEPPYLVTQPSRNDAELVTVEWLQFLVDTAGVVGAAQTLSYYESVGWISEPVERYLRSMLNGYGEGTKPVTERESDPEPRSVLTTDEHKRSLQYIAWIADPDQAPDLLATTEE